MKIKPELVSMIKMPYLPDFDLYIGKYHTWTSEEFDNMWDIVKEYTPHEVTQEDIDFILNINREPIAGKITERSIKKAKDMPLDKILKFERGLAKCIFHNDSNPSFYYYKKDNRAYCFSCNKSADSIDIIMKLRGCDFNSAVKYLNA